MKHLKIFLAVACGLVFTCTHAQQDNTSPETQIKSDGGSCGNGCTCDHNGTPVGITTDHVHPKGTWVFSYTYMNTMLQGNNIGANKVSDNTVYKNYMMAPETMSMQMHMAMVMYGVTDRLTVMAMGGYMVNNMSMNMSSTGMTMPGMYMPLGSMTMLSNSAGFTDTKVSALYNFSNIAAQRIIGSIGMSLPTGTINAMGTTILGNDERLAYDMQTGTGSYSVDPDITYTRKFGLFYLGADAGADVKLNYNSLGYKDGNVYHATAWAGYQFLPWLCGTLRAEDVHTDMMSGSDKVLDNEIYQENDPTTKTGNYGGTWMNMYAGLNFHLMKPVIEHFRIMAEYGMPVYQNLNGTQVALKSNLLAGVQYSF
jgi:hypothetical protein